MRTASVLIVALAAACLHEPELVPARGAQVLPGRAAVAVQEVNGVRVEVEANAWTGSPANLTDILVPVRVAIENRSGRPLRIRYRDFALLGRSGFHYTALPPLTLRGSASNQAPYGQVTAAELRVTATFRPRFFHRGFYVARPWAFYYPGLTPWAWGFAYDPSYYDRYYAGWPSQLPSQDMLEEALPEGAIDDGGSVAGFVYFEPATRRERQVDFLLTLADAKDDVRLGAVDIPFVVSR
jgi:hypothetical protein